MLLSESRALGRGELRCEERSTVSHTNSYLLYHVVFATKGRQPWIDAEMAPRLFAYFGGLVRQRGGIAAAVNGMPEHVHLLLRLTPAHSVADVVRSLKAASSRWVRSTFPKHRTFTWQTGYGCFSVSRSQRTTVRQYIRDQQTHHRTRGFLDEFVSLLKAHGLQANQEDGWD